MWPPSVRIHTFVPRIRTVESTSFHTHVESDAASTTNFDLKLVSFRLVPKTTADKNSAAAMLRYILF